MSANNSGTLARSRRQRGLLITLTLLLLLASISAAVLVPIPKHIPAVALDSEWVFRGIVLVAFQVAVAVVWMITSKVITGEPFEEIGAFGFNIRNQVEKAKGKLERGATALESAHKASLEG